MSPEKPNQTCLEQLGMVLGNAQENGDVLQVESQDLGAKDTFGCRARSDVPALPTSMPEQLKNASVKEMEKSEYE